MPESFPVTAAEVYRDVKEHQSSSRVHNPKLWTNVSLISVRDKIVGVLFLIRVMDALEYQ